MHQAEDCDITCKIWEMVATEGRGNASAEWIAWAKAKGDWYDPMVAAKNSILGRRNHSLPDPDVLAADIIENLRSAMDRFNKLMVALKK